MRLQKSLLELLLLGGDPVPQALKRHQGGPPSVTYEHRLLRCEATTAVSNARLQEMLANPVIEPDPARHLEHVGAGQLRDVRDLVDERDLGGQERVGGKLDHLGAGHIGAHQRRVERGV